MRKKIVKYSEAFKLQIVSELESGKFSSDQEARYRYGIKGGSTIASWVRKYGKKHLQNKVIRVETMQDRDELKELKARIRKLESALSDAHLDLRLERALSELLSEAAGIEDFETLKKKANMKLSTKQ